MVWKWLDSCRSTYSEVKRRYAMNNNSTCSYDWSLTNFNIGEKCCISTYWSTSSYSWTLKLVVDTYRILIICKAGTWSDKHIIFNYGVCRNVYIWLDAYIISDDYITFNYGSCSNQYMLVFSLITTLWPVLKLSPMTTSLYIIEFDLMV